MQKIKKPSVFRPTCISSLVKHMTGFVAGIIIASLAIFFVSDHFMREGFEGRIAKELETAKHIVDEYVTLARKRLAHEAFLLAGSDELKKALAERDIAALRGFAQRAMYNADASFATITDERGFVLARGRGDGKGDDISDSEIMRKAISGSGSVDIAPLRNNGLSVAAAVPVFIDDIQVGVLLFGDAFRTNALVDSVKRIASLEATVFEGDKRISTTIERNGKRIVGSLLDTAAVRMTVFVNGVEYAGDASILGSPYRAVYWPIRSGEGKILGIWFVGTETGDIESAVFRTTLSCLIGTLLISSTLAILGIFFFRSLVNPLERQAHVDALTGIANRAGFKRAFGDIFSGQSACGALFLIDLDNFKTVNDNLGHPVGDEVLVHAAQVLKDVFRGKDIVARLGGDEFVVYAPTLDSVDVVKAKAESLLTKILKTYVLPGGGSVTVTTSIGVALYPRDGATYESIYHNADTALYAAKDGGRNRYVIFGAGDDGNAVPEAGRTEQPAPGLRRKRGSSSPPQRLPLQPGAEISG